MRKILAFIALLSMSLFLVSCGNGKENKVELDDLENKLSNLEIDKNDILEFDSEFKLHQYGKTEELGMVFEINSQMSINFKGKLKGDKLNSNLVIDSKNSTTIAGTEITKEEKMNVNIYLNNQIAYMELVNYLELEIPVEESKVKLELSEIFDMIFGDVIPGDILPDDNIDLDLDNEKVLKFLDEFTGFNVTEKGDKLTIEVKINKEILNDNINTLYLFIKEVIDENIILADLKEAINEIDTSEFNFKATFKDNKLSTVDFDFKLKATQEGFTVDLEMKLTIKKAKDSFPEFPDFKDFKDFKDVTEFPDIM